MKAVSLLRLSMLVILLIIITACDKTPSAPNSGQESVAFNTPYNRMYFEPVDETRDTPETRAFFSFYKRALAEKDLDFILSHTDQMIYNGKNHDSGLTAFKKIWKLEEGQAGSRLWITLRDVVYLGGTVRKEDDKITMFFPYTIKLFDERKDAASFAAITGKGVNIRQRPGMDTPIIGQLNNEFVRYVPYKSSDLVWLSVNGESYPWYRIVTPEGLTGYVYGRYFQIATGFRALFEKKSDNEWVLTALYADNAEESAIGHGDKQ